ncbi:hypothetical protein EZV73_01690 [Acidaminobacter sp. JC074]|uniref:hypothetical protein n=1 Tax=Acidaminobacter sp. JC074 TaxID=2530199 RepID=UPI001F116AD1|nr:hypothetical protein [Acidaminobacter sp. JC074]MCH4886257.1 hypothetical protein [Acidaminobacter sp. JC074]
MGKKYFFDLIEKRDAKDIEGISIYGKYNFVFTFIFLVVIPLFIYFACVNFHLIPNFKENRKILEFITFCLSIVCVKDYFLSKHKHRELGLEKINATGKFQNILHDLLVLGLLILSSVLLLINTLDGNEPFMTLIMLSLMFIHSKSIYVSNTRISISHRIYDMRDFDKYHRFDDFTLDITAKSGQVLSVRLKKSKMDRLEFFLKSLPKERCKF